jgi:predicted double-glycine peptidase
MITKVIQSELKRRYSVDVRDIGDSKVFLVSQYEDRLATAKVNVTRDAIIVATMTSTLPINGFTANVVAISKSDPTMLDNMNQRLDKHFSQGARRVVPR